MAHSRQMPVEEAPRTIGKYKILGTLGRGSMGVVYRAEDPEIGRQVAIKTLRSLLPGQFAEADSMLQRFSQEARSAGRLRHPNVVTIFEVNRDGDTPYIVMDYIEGQTLDTMIARQGKLDPRMVMRYLGQIALGLEYAHSNGVIHRDIKSSNILIDQLGNAFILDFGVATISQGPLAPQSTVMGTPAYMAPEQILNQEIDQRADLFGLAVVCFECLCGERPFLGDNFTAVIANIVNGKPRTVREIVPAFPETLELDFLKALARNREDRFSSATQMIKAFESSLGFSPGQQQGASPPAEIVPFKRRRSSSSNWRRVRPRRYSETRLERPSAQVMVDSKGIAKRRNSSGEILSPWNAPESIVDEQGRVKGKGKGQVSSGVTPGASLFGPSSANHEYGAPQPGKSKQPSSPMFLATTALGFISLLTLGVLVYTLFGNTAPTPPVPEAPIQAPVLPAEGVAGSAPVDLVNSAPEVVDAVLPEFNTLSELSLSEVDPIPEGVSIYEMTDRQILGVLVSGGVPDDQVLEALKEASSRRIPRLLEASIYPLRHDSYLVRISAVQAVAALGDKRIVPRLLELLDDHDALVRGFTAKSLAQLGDRKAVPYLSSRLTREESSEVKIAIKKAIEKLNGFPVSP